MDIIKLKDVVKRYKKHTILDDVNLTIEEGDLLGVIGASGSGKTTLLNLIAGFVEPSDGDVVYISRIDKKEKDLGKNLKKIKQFIGYTPQHNSFYHKLTVMENLVHFGKLYGIKKDTLMHNIENLLNFTQLANHKNKLADHLSGGMQKRLDISCSLVHKPKILILDEPTADLDPLLKKEILNLLVEVNKQGITVVIASHDLKGIEQICNKVAIVHKGKVQKFGLMDEVRKPFLRDHFVINVDSDLNKEHIVKKLHQLPINKIVDQGHQMVIYPDDVEHTMSSLIKIIKEENLVISDMDLRKPSLNDIFEKVASEN